MTDQADEIALQEIVYKPTTLDSNPKRHKPTNMFPLYLAAITSDLMSFSAGIAFAWSYSVLPQLMVHENSSTNPLGHPITQSESSWIDGLAHLGAIFGPLVAGPIAAEMGRKRTLLLLAYHMVVSFLIVAFANTVLLFYFARLLMGLGAGGVFAVLPMYVGEIATDENRGALGCLITVFTTAGALFVYCVGPFLSVQNFSLACITPLAIFLSVFSWWNPESPEFLASIGDQKALQESLMKLRNTPNIQEEINTIKRSLQQYNQNQGRIDLFRYKNLRKAVTIVIGLLILQGFSGLTPVLFYIQSIFARSGLNQEYSTIIIGAIYLSSTIVATFLVDRLGKRILLLISTTCSGLALFLFGWFPIFGLIGFILAAGVGLQPIPWAIMGEMFPPNVKTSASTLSTISCFVAAASVSVPFPFLVDSLGIVPTFCIFGVVCVFGSVFVYLMVPETKGKSLQQIQEHLQK